MQNGFCILFRVDYLVGVSTAKVFSLRQEDIQVRFKEKLCCLIIYGAFQDVRPFVKRVV